MGPLRRQVQQCEHGATQQERQKDDGQDHGKDRRPCHRQEQRKQGGGPRSVTPPSDTKTRGATRPWREANANFNFAMERG